MRVRETWAAGALIVVAGCLLPGCASPNALPREYAEGLAMVTQKIADQGVLDKWASEARANIQNPGLESYINTRISVGVRIVGMNGEFDVETGGAGTKLPSGLRESLIAQLDGPISDEQRASILLILGWNRESDSAVIRAGP